MSSCNITPLFICACNKFELPVAWRSPTSVKLRVATADLCLVCLLCFRSTCNGIERSSSSHHTINLVYISIYIYIYLLDDLSAVFPFFCTYFPFIFGVAHILSVRMLSFGTRVCCPLARADVTYVWIVAVIYGWSRSAYICISVA